MRYFNESAMRSANGERNQCASGPKRTQRNLQRQRLSIARYTFLKLTLVVEFHDCVHYSRS